MQNKYCVLDLETTSIHSFKRFCNPFDKRNKIVVFATLLQGGDPVLEYDPEQGVGVDHLDWTQFNFIVGHNVKFDLLFLWHDAQFQQWLKDGGRVWDTMLAEYLLSGQKTTYPSLDSLTEQYGGELKDDRVTEQFKAGMGADQIDPEILLPYAEGDVVNTELIFLGQTKQAKEEGMISLILGYMEHYLGLCEMEFNGLFFDLEKAKELQGEYEQKVLEAEETCIAKATPNWSIDVPFNPASDDHVSAVLFNSPVIIDEVIELKDEDGEPLRYGPKALKAGQIKTRKEKRTYYNEGFGISTWYSSPTKKKDVFSTGKDIIGEIVESGKAPEARPFMEALIEHREATKFLNTYLYGKKAKNQTEDVETGLIPLAQPIDGCIHHTLDAVQTKTGRLNSRNPNAQNIPGALLELFTSRYGDEGTMVAIDYAQLEIRLQAFLCQSKTMIQDIKDDLDFHVLYASYIVGKPYEVLMAEVQAGSAEAIAIRKKAKAFTYGRVYGAAPARLATATGLTPTKVEEIMAKADARYPEVEAFYAEVQDQIKRSRIPTDRALFIRNKQTGDTITRPGYNQGIGYYTSVTGKKYHFYESAVLTKYGKVFSYFHPPDVYNFPVQGLAADIVALQVGRLYRFAAQHRDKFLLVNEIHDEVLLDMKKEHYDEMIPQIKAILEDIDTSFKQRFHLNFNVPVTVDVSQGTSWGDCK